MSKLDQDGVRAQGEERIRRREAKKAKRQHMKKRYVRSTKWINGRERGGCREKK